MSKYNPEDYILDTETSLEEELSLPKEAPAAELPDIVTKFPIHYNIRTLSYSGLLTLHSCPRKYELYRLTPRPKFQEDEAGHLAFGTVVGNGVQELVVTGSLNKAIFRAFLDWKESIDEDKADKSAKTFWHAIYAIQKFVPFRESFLAQYEVAYFQGKPASELGFQIDLGEGFRLRGKLDLLLIHKRTKKFLVIELKTTGMTNVDEAMYKNSNQGLSYKLVVDRIAFEMGVDNEYGIVYPVYLTRKLEWMEFLFPKTEVQLASFLQGILLDVGHIRQYATLNYFPPMGESCFSFGRQCQFFGMCGMSNSGLLLNEPTVVLDKEGEFPFKFSVDELIEAQVERE